MAEKKKQGRPKKELDTEMIERLSSIFCTNEEIASIVGCHRETLANNYSTYIKKGRERGKSSLRRLQFQKAQDGNTTMLIWLGKQYLGQSDHNFEGDEHLPLPFVD
tara:strand:+ start:3566 stop:3883 length:318 start_codon:yes stop_codon:yes gene_type:complete